MCHIQQSDWRSPPLKGYSTRPALCVYLWQLPETKCLLPAAPAGTQAGITDSAAGAGSTGHHLSSGAIAGATIGSLAGVALIAAAAVLASRRMRRQPERPESMATFNQAYNSNA